MDQVEGPSDPDIESPAVLELRKELEEAADRLHDSELPAYVIRDKIRNVCLQKRHHCEKEQGLISNVGLAALLVLLVGFGGTFLSEYPISLFGIVGVVFAIITLTLIGGRSIVISDMLAEIDRFAISQGLMENERTAL